ncbi:MAG: spore coat protein H [Myxococcota bacterium]|jgi:spore coat protein H
MRFETLVLTLMLASCSSEEPTYSGCESEQQSGDGVSYDPLSMGCVNITMEPDDYEDLSNQFRFSGEEDDQWPELIAHAALSCSEPFPSGYEYVYADIEVDGWQAHDVGIRKKGFIGSVVGAGDRPSLKIKTDEFVDGQEMGDTERITLNNNHQDVSRIRTCMAYSVFEDAGYPAPRCNLANVSVNGSGLGTYTHVESIKKRFLRREFGNDDGSLYEGSLADFTDAHLAGLPDNLGRFEDKTSDTDPTGAGLRRVADALQVPDDELEAALVEVIDLDAFMLFWALETVVNHNDGYNANINNFYVYFDPDNADRAVLIPWGADQALHDWDRVKVTSELARRISRVPELQQRYLDEVQWVIDSVWDEEVLSERIELFEAQVATAEGGVPYQADSIEGLRGWVGDRRSAINDFIADGGEFGAAETSPCTGATDPLDFLLVAELVAVSGAGCAVAPHEPAGFFFALLFLAARRRRSGLDTVRRGMRQL